MFHRTFYQARVEFLPAAKPRRSMDHKPPRMYVSFISWRPLEAKGTWKHTGLEAAMASEAVGGNMHMDSRVIKVADVKSEVI